MTTPDFRAELVVALEKSDLTLADDNLLDRVGAAYRATAGAALAAEPGQGVPSDEDVEAWADLAGYIKGSGDHPCGFWVEPDDLGKIVRAVVARYGTHPAPVAVGVADEELPVPRVQE